MIEITAVLDEAGLLRSCTVTGHAAMKSVCGAVSVLMRTALRVLFKREGIETTGGASEPGVFWINIEAYTGEGRDFLCAAGTFLTEGLRSVSQDHPDCCIMNIYRAEEIVWLESEAAAAPKTDGIPTPNILALKPQADHG
ncbi:MAG: ribosomal-processing cysteine protease Prp [Spirochaetaceae bacterium]|nr:ribosomal-processing cysteine protease Prp [Spirochaetaceae bacterium]